EMNIRFLAPLTQSIRNGNTVTCERWRSFFQDLGHRVFIGEEALDERCDLLVVFNACKNRRALSSFMERDPAQRLIVCLTGTDLYQDLKDDPGADEALRLADQLVVLHPLALKELPCEYRDKAMVIFQSAEKPQIRPPGKSDGFDVCVIAHLREVKDPLRAAYAARLLPPDSGVRVLLVGKALSEELGAAAEREMAVNRRFRWLGEKSAEDTAGILLRSRLLVVSSLFEGGANVVSEAIVSDVPVVGSDMACMRGLLGEDYPGLFPVGDTRRLADLLLRAERDEGFYAELAERCRRESRKFDPALERENLKILLQRAWARRV
ncbi:MAG: selenoneine biosynthesis selenosugar synthase SenB, partial [Geobacteraceae bacterium]|nr:selenoneine biosynthesis selenosugar synthase SenB [Geobacteraceae bacterium]